MVQNVEEYFDELVPGAGDRAAEFLGVVRDRCSAAGIGIELRPHAGRRKRRLVLRGRLQLGKGLLKTRPMQLEVFADPVGNALQVGWHVTKEVKGETSFKSVAFAEDMQDRLDNRLDSQRQMSGILTAFDKLVFQPVLKELAAAVEGSAPGGPAGFLRSQ